MDITTMTQSRNHITEGYRETTGLTESERHRLLMAERRRIAIDILADRPAPVNLKVLAAEVAEREAGVDATSEDAVKRVMTTLHHTHLPRMDAAGVIDYDPSEFRVISATLYLSPVS